MPLECGFFRKNQHFGSLRQQKRELSMLVIRLVVDERFSEYNRAAA